MNNRCTPSLMVVVIMVALLGLFAGPANAIGQKPELTITFSAGLFGNWEPCPT